jgi:hypothetical protein
VGCGILLQQNPKEITVSVPSFIKDPSKDAEVRVINETGTVITFTNSISSGFLHDGSKMDKLRMIKNTIFKRLFMACNENIFT